MSSEKVSEISDESIYESLSSTRVRRSFHLCVSLSASQDCKKKQTILELGSIWIRPFSVNIASMLPIKQGSLKCVICGFHLFNNQDNDIDRWGMFNFMLSNHRHTSEK